MHNLLHWFKNEKVFSLLFKANAALRKGSLFCIINLSLIEHKVSDVDILAWQVFFRDSLLYVYTFLRFPKLSFSLPILLRFFCLASRFFFVSYEIWSFRKFNRDPFWLLCIIMCWFLFLGNGSLSKKLSMERKGKTHLKFCSLTIVVGHISTSSNWKWKLRFHLKIFEGTNYFFLQLHSHHCNFRIGPSFLWIFEYFTHH
jgi:hypothetical protein